MAYDERLAAKMAFINAHAEGIAHQVVATIICDDRMAVLNDLCRTMHESLSGHGASADDTAMLTAAFRRTLFRALKRLERRIRERAYEIFLQLKATAPPGETNYELVLRHADVCNAQWLEQVLEELRPRGLEGDAG
jgi:hypothetical protein